ncbi:MAG: hypothetical protein IKB98_03415 [Clostridia bacterium]|nr:hypothetical protein [Clostridia bacterium]
MNDYEKFDYYVRTLAELSAFLTRLKFEKHEADVSNNLLKSIIEQERQLKREPASRSLPNADRQLNKRKKVQNRQPWSQKELIDMPYLKDLKYRQTSDGIHQFRYRRDGYNLSFNSKSYEKAKKKAYDFIFELKAMLRNSAEKTCGKTLDFVANAWLNLKKAHSDKKTCAGYESVYRLHIAPTFGKRSVKGLLPIDFQPFFDKLFETSGRTCENAKIILNGVFKYAVANRFCASNPIEGVIVEKHFRTPGQALSREKIQEFKQVMRTAGKYGLAGLIILFTGIRGAELKSLTFDWSAGTWTVDNAKLKKSQKKNPGNLQRTVPIFPDLYDLKDRIQNEDWKISSQRLSNNFKERWPENNVKDLRHTFSTVARECGIENELVNVWMGHSAGNNLTANTYTHFSIEFQKEQAQKLRF